MILHVFLNILVICIYFCFNDRINVMTSSEISITGINTLDYIENDIMTNIDESVSHELTTVRESEINSSSLMYV